MILIILCFIKSIKKWLKIAKSKSCKLYKTVFKTAKLKKRKEKVKVEDIQVKMNLINNPNNSNSNNNKTTSI